MPNIKKRLLSEVGVALLFLFVGLGIIFWGNLDVANAVRPGYTYRVNIHQSGPGNSTLTITPGQHHQSFDPNHPPRYVASVITYWSTTFASGLDPGHPFKFLEECEGPIGDMGAIPRLLKDKWKADIENNIDLKNTLTNLTSGDNYALEFPLGGEGFEEGNNICVVAMELDIDQSPIGFDYKEYTIDSFTLTKIPELIPPGGSVNLADFETFPDRLNLDWDAAPPPPTPPPRPTGFNYPGTLSSEWENRFLKEDQSTQTGQIILSTDACKSSWLTAVRNAWGVGLPAVFDPYHPHTATGHNPHGPPHNKGDVDNIGSICSPQTYLNVSVDPGEKLELYIKDLCINGWDRASTTGTTRLKFWRVKDSDITNVGDWLPGPSIEVDHGGSADGCYERWDANGKLPATDPNHPDYPNTEHRNPAKKKMALTLFDVDHDLLNPTGPTGGQKEIIVKGTETATINTHAVHLYELIELPGLTDGWSYVIDASISEGTGFNVFGLGVATNHSGGPDHGKITFDNRLFGGVGESSVLSVSNNTYYSNGHIGSPQHYRSNDRNGWTYTIDIAPSCSAFAGVLVDKIRKQVGLFDSDIWSSGFAGGHYFKVSEASKTGALPNSATIWNEITNPNNPLQFNGFKNNQPPHDPNQPLPPDINNDDPNNISVANNATEAFTFDFEIDKMYRVEFSEIHHRNFVQFVLPFGQEGLDEECDNTPPEVVFDQQCNLRLKSVDWKHPATKTPHGFINFDILHEKRTGELDFVRHPLSGKDYKIVAGSLQMDNPAKYDEPFDDKDSLIISFKPDEDNPGIPTWLSLIDNDQIDPNDPNDPIHIQRREQVQLTGYYDDHDNNNLKSAFNNYPSATHDPIFRKVQADGHGEFRLMKDDVGEYYFMTKDENRVDLRVPEDPDSYCTWTEFEIEIDEECNIDIIKLNWSRPNVPKPKLRIDLKYGPTNAKVGNSFTNIAQQTDQNKKKRLLAYLPDNNIPIPNQVSIKGLIASGEMNSGAVNHYYFQITGYYKDDGTVVDIDGGVDIAYDSGRIAGYDNPGPPAVHFHIHSERADPNDPNSDLITKNRYAAYERDNSNWKRIEDFKTQPVNPLESCDHSTNPVVKFETNPVNPDVCDLRLISSEWTNTADDLPNYVEITVTRTLNSSNSPGWSSGGTEEESIKAPTAPGLTPYTLIEWVDSSINPRTFKHLIDNNRVSVNDEFQVHLTGYYGPPNDTVLIRYNDPSSRFSPAGDRGDKVLVDGHPEFIIRRGPNNTGYYFEIGSLTAPSGLDNICNPDPPPLEFEIEVNDDCDIVITSLDWNGYEDDHDNNPNTGHAALGSNNKFIVEIRPTANNDRSNGPTKKLVSGTLPLTYFEFINSNPPSLKSLLNGNGVLEYGRPYEVHLVGFSVGSSHEKPFEGGVTYPADGIGGSLSFSIGSDRKDRVHLANGITKPPPPDGCLDGPEIPFVNISINQISCDIIIDSIGWNSNDGLTHDLELTFGSGAVTSQRPSPTAKVLYAFDSANPPYGGQLQIGAYNIFLTGYFDAGDGGARKNFSTRDPSLADREPALGVPGFTIVYTPNLQAYHIIGPNGRIPSNPNEYCFEDPCSQPTPPPQCQSPRCSIPDQFKWANHPNTPHLKTGIYGTSSVYNSVWYKSSPYSPVNGSSDIISTDRYHSTFHGNVPSGSTIRINAGNTGPFSSPQYPSTYYVMPLANRPGGVIPGTPGTAGTNLSGRQEIIDDLINGGDSGDDGFEFNFNDDWDSDKRKRRDSVWAMFGDNYKPKTSVKWNPGQATYSGSGGGYNGWENTYTLKIQPLKLDYENPPSANVINYPGSPYFSPQNRTQSTPNNFDFIDFETRYDQFRGNSQTDDLLTYKWNFHWKIDATHKHTVDYDQYDLDVSRKGYTWRNGTRQRESYTYHHNDPGDPPGTPTHSHSGTRWGPWSYGPTYTSYVDGRNRSVPSSSGGTGSTRYDVLSSWNDEWSYYGTSHTETETRRTTLTGELSNCSYVLIVKPPECRVRRRRLFSGSTEKRINPSGVRYEIFPPGNPDTFSELQVLNENPFSLQSTSITKATLRPTLNTNSPWHPRDNSDTPINPLPAVGPETNRPIIGKDYKSGVPAITYYNENLITPEWPGEYRLNWIVGWSPQAKSNFPTIYLHYDDPYRGGDYYLYHTWQGDEPPAGDLACNNPTDGIYVYVSAKPPVCRVKYSIFEIGDPNTRIKIGLQNNNWVDLLFPGKSAATSTGPPWGHITNINPGIHNAIPYGPGNYNLPQGYKAKRPNTAIILPDVPDPIAGDVDNLSTQNIPRANHPITSNSQWLDITSDDRMATMPAPLGRYTYTWDLRARLGIEWWSTTDTGKLPVDSNNNPAWWAGDNNSERIRLALGGTNRLGTPDCQNIIRIVRIPFIKTFIGGMSAGGRFGLGNEFDSCSGSPNNWIPVPRDPTRGIWGHSADIDHSTSIGNISTAVGSSVEQALRAQKSIDGVYSSSLTDQLATNEPKALTFANNLPADTFGGNFSNSNYVSWRCLPNYWQIPDNANLRDPNTNPPTIIAGLSWIDPNDTKEGAQPPANGLGDPSGLKIKDGDVLHIKGDLEITGDIRQTGEKDLRATIYVEGDVTISGDIINNDDDTKKYYGFSDMGLIQIIAKGNIRVRPGVTRIDATLVAYPADYDSNAGTSEGGTIDLCDSKTTDAKIHYDLCGSNVAISTDLQLRINGALVAQRIYFNRLHESLRNQRNPEPLGATYGNTQASEVIVLMPEYHFTTPAASVFDDWVKRPQAIFDIPTSL